MPHEYKDGETVDGSEEGPIIHGVESGTTVRAVVVNSSGAASVDTELPDAVTAADNMANPTAPQVLANVMGYDGTNWDRARFLALGIQTESGSLPVVIASDQPDINISLDSEVVAIGDGTDTVSVEAMTDDDHDIDGVNGLVTASQLYGRIDADTVKPLRMDGATHSLQTIDYAHHEVHGGSHFTYTQVSDDWDIAAPVELLIVTPDTTKWAHMVINVEAALDTNVKLCETSTHTVLAAQNVYNNNRNSGTSNTTTINTHNDDGADGTLIFESQFGISAGGGANKITGGGESRAEQEWILKQDESYLLVITTGTDASSLSIKISWYEHADKD